MFRNFGRLMAAFKLADPAAAVGDSRTKAIFRGRFEPRTE